MSRPILAIRISKDPMFIDLVRSERIVVLFFAIGLLFALASSVSGQSDTAEREAAEIYRKYRAAIGGEGALGRIKSAETVTEIELLGSKRTERRIEDPINKRWYSVSEGGVEGKQESGFDGNRQWVRSNFYRGFTNEAGSFVGEPKRIRLPNEELDGKVYLIIEEIPSVGSGSSKLYIDPETFLMAVRRIRTERGGNTIEQTTRFSDYQRIDGILIAMTETIDAGAVKVIRRKVSIRHNVDFDPSIFLFDPEDNADDGKDSTTAPAASPEPGVRKESAAERTLTAEIRKATFNLAWSKINDSYFDPTFHGVDWAGVKAKYEPELENVSTSEQLNDLLNRMFGELGRSHLRVIAPGDVMLNGINSTGVKRGGIGVELRLVEGEVVITRVRESSPAEKAGLRRGDIIKAVNGVAVGSVENEEKAKGGFQLRREIALPRAVNARLNGPADDKVHVTYVSQSGKEKSALIEREVEAGLGELNIEARKLTPSVGYIRVNIFMGDLPAKFAAALEPLKGLPALIVDLRGNPGGIGNHTTAVAAMLDRNKGSLGTSKYRYGKQSFDYTGTASSYNGRLIFLVDEMTASSAEILAEGLRVSGRATVVGLRTAGAVLPSVAELLPNGAAIQFPVADFVTVDGKQLEGRGVTPDIEVGLTRPQFAAGKDLILEAALKAIGLVGASLL